MTADDNDRRLRIQYPDAIYHLMSRGVQRSSIYLSDEDRYDFFERCGATVDRFGWRIFVAVQLVNHFHLLLQTPEPNLCRGAQYLLGTYARGFNRRNERSGHVFEGRYRCYVIEDDSYLWTASRYDHLNPTPGLVEHPALWPWSTYPGFCDPSLRLPWACYDGLLRAWEGEFGGAAEAYRQFVESGLSGEAPVALPDLVDGWIMGSESFAQRIRRLVSPESNEPTVLRSRRQPGLTLADVVDAVCREFDIPPKVLAQKSSRHLARPILAVLGNQLSTATLHQLALALGLAGRDSLHKTIQRVQANPSPEFLQQLAAVQSRLQPTESGLLL